MIPHRFCLSNPTLAGLSFAFDLLITLAYYALPVFLMMIYAARPRSSRWAYSIRSYILVLFSAFIFACGTTHLFEILTLFVPWYWTEVSVKGICAAISVTTAVLVFKRRSQLISFPTKLEKEHFELEDLRRRIAILVQNS